MSQNLRPHLYLYVLASLLALSCLSLAAPRPNVILAMADDMGWGDPEYNSSRVTFADGTPHPDQGWIHTPTMNAMAANGLRFDRFYSASAVCSPTRASCLTGRNPFRVGVPYANEGRLGFDETPLSEVLAAQGYRCGHFGKWHLGTMTTLRSDANRASNGNTGAYSAPWHHGYDFCFATESKVPTYHPYRKPTNGLALPTDFSDPNFYGTRYWQMPATWNQSSGEGIIVPVAEINNPADGDSSRLLARQVIPFIQNAVADDEPFFVVLWFHTPHKPMVDPAGGSAVDSSAALKASIEDMDSALGMVRDELTALGVRDNTMFWMTSDNGPETGANSPNETNTTRSITSGRFLERKRSLHEGGVRVPGILEWPDRIPSGRVTDFPAVTSDYYPTILDFLELTVPGQKPLDGISLRPVIAGTATTRTNPIGFKIESKKSWVNHQYKLLDKGSGWLLYDLIHIPAGEEVEQTPIATAANINSQPQAIRDVYNTMLAEYTAWDNAVGSDIPYVHPSRPTVTLQAPQATVDGPFQVTATFSENISQLHAGEFAVVNGTATALSGSGSIWTVTITPSSTGEVTVSLPEAAAIDADGNPNAPSNTLSTSSNNLPRGAIISNGDLGTAVTQYGSSDGSTGYYLDTTTLDVFEQASTASPVDTARNAGEWVWSRLSRGFAYNATGGAAGDGAFVAYTGADAFNQRPRAVVQFAHNGSTTTGPQTFAMDVFLDDNSASHALTFLVQLYAWNDGQTGPRLSLGGGTANVATYNVTTLGDAQTLLDTRIAATSVTDAAWQTVTLGQLDLGTGYDFYAWRIGVMGQSPGDGFAFDHLRLVPPADPTVTLYGSGTTSSKTNTVFLTFSDEVTGLEPGDFVVDNGSVTEVRSAGRTRSKTDNSYQPSRHHYSALVTADAPGTVQVTLPAGAVTRPDNPDSRNTASNTFSFVCSGDFNGPWVVDAAADWTSATGSSSNLLLSSGFATPTANSSAFTSVVRTSPNKRKATKLTFRQSPVWDHWVPLGYNIRNSIGTDAPVLIPVGPNNYYILALSGSVYHAWHSTNMVNWTHKGAVTSGPQGRWVTSAEYKDGFFYIYSDHANDHTAHVFRDNDLGDGVPGTYLGPVLTRSGSGSDLAAFRDNSDGLFHLIYEDWSPIDASQNAWDSPLAGHTSSPDGINGFFADEHPAPVDHRTTPTGTFGSYAHPAVSFDPTYEIHTPAQDAYGDWTAIKVGEQYYLFGDYDPHGQPIRLARFTGKSIYGEFDLVGSTDTGGHPDPTVGFAEGKFYLITQKDCFQSPGPWVDGVESRAGVDVDGNGSVDTWTDWQMVRESYDHTPDYIRVVTLTPAALDLSGLPPGFGFQFEFRVDDTVVTGVSPIMDRVEMSFAASNFEQWSIQNEVAVEARGDHNRNQIPNLVEFALGQASPPARQSDGTLTLKAAHGALVDGYTVGLRFSRDLKSWTLATPDTEDVKLLRTTTLQNGDQEMVFDIPSGSEQLFWQIVVF